jgi:hypothetical protein
MNPGDHESVPSKILDLALVTTSWIESRLANQARTYRYRALDPNHLDNPNRLIKNENTFKSADELKLKRTETIALDPVGRGW